MTGAIVFGTTLEPDSHDLAEVAARLAHRMSAELRLLHVCEDPRAAAVLGTDEEHVLGTVRARLEAEAARLRALVDVVVRPHLAAGTVVDALVSVARLELAQALLLGDGGRAAGRLLGSNAERASRVSAVPVVTLRDAGRFLAWLRGERALRVLVGADAGVSASAARAFAASWAALGDVTVDVVFVVAPTDAHGRLGLPPPLDPHRLGAEAEAALLRELERATPPSERGAALRVAVGRGAADAHLVGLADQGNYDLVIVGQRRQSSVEALWLGSVARGVLRAAPVSVGCVPPSAGETTIARPARVILVGTDFSSAARHALVHAAALAPEGGAVHIAHVLRPDGADARGARDRAADALHRLCAQLDVANGVRIESHLLEGAPAAQLLALALRVGAGMVVLGCTPRSALDRAVLGSVAQSLVENTRIPLLLVPAPAP